ncbi:hypothetical protein HZB00_04365 [Candidatus Woesearchaeota archaeon]|nr:hypothetical protein [Candidatus Woesearchaeota archaeon]
MKKIIKIRKEKEKLAGRVKHKSKEFLALDKNNFSWSKKQVKHILIKKNSAYATLWQGADAHIEFTMSDNSVKKFIIIAGQDAERIKKRLIAFSSKVELR